MNFDGISHDSSQFFIHSQPTLNQHKNPRKFAKKNPIFHGEITRSFSQSLGATLQSNMEKWIAPTMENKNHMIFPWKKLYF